jgi:hypothetical protein
MCRCAQSGLRDGDGGTRGRCMVVMGASTECSMTMCLDCVRDRLCLQPFERPAARPARLSWQLGGPAFCLAFCLRRSVMASEQPCF